MSTAPHLTVVMYHYVRDLARTPWPRIKALLLEDFRQQLATLRRDCHVATIEEALAFLQGDYTPRRPLYLLTFDDALREHAVEVVSMLDDMELQGTFLIQTAALEGTVAAVHKNHFLLAALPFARYRREFFERFAVVHPETSTEVSKEDAARAYRWDKAEVAEFKYFLNFVVPGPERERILTDLFAENLGDEAQFARNLYYSWVDARSMQRAGMVMGGHSHTHAPLTSLPSTAMRDDLSLCATLLRRHLEPQQVWPFSYPYGRVNDDVVGTLKALDFSCGFTTQVGINTVEGADLFRIRRIDPKDVKRLQDAAVSST